MLLLAMVLAEAANHTQPLANVENLYTDLWHRVSGVRDAAQHVVLVVVDDQSLAQHGNDPLVFWTPLFAQAASTLREAGVAVIGMDFLFSITPENWIRKLDLPRNDSLRNYDLGFRQELNKGEVVLAGAITRGKNEDSLLLPHADYLLSLPNMNLAAYVGLADMVTDADGGIRRYAIAPRLSLPKELAGGAPQLTLGALLALRATGLNTGAKEWQIGQRTIRANDINTISFSGPPGAIPRLPISQVLAAGAVNDPAMQALRGKVVIIGGEYHGMNDVHYTPYSGRLVGTGVKLMTGAEIQANIVETLLAGKVTQPAPDWVRWLLLVILIGLTVALYQIVSPWAGLGVLALGLLLCMTLGLAAFQGYWLLPVAYLQLGLASTYVLAFGSRLTREQREQIRVRQMFGRYVSDSVVDTLLLSGKPPDLGGVSMQITVLFSDIRNFTTITEKLNAHEVVEFLNEYFERACAPVLEAGGTIDKFIGDAIMVQFGAPVAFPDHAARALRAACRMREVAQEFHGWMQQRFAGRNLPAFEVGIGIHTGEAVVGNLGCSKRTEFTAIGDTVNLASRIEGETVTLGCVIVASVETVRAASGLTVTTGRNEVVSVKGRSQPIEIFEIVNIKE